MAAPRTRQTVLSSLAEIRAGIQHACERSHRDPGSVRVVAAGKAVSAEALGWAREGGIRDVGENYVQELAAKRQILPGVTWHYIGTLQSHTAHRVAELADVVQTAVPGRALERLARRVSERGRTAPVLIEVDLTGERTGVAPEALGEAADAVASTQGLELVGLMTVPAIPRTPEDARPAFAHLRALRDRLAEHHPGADELSMGMSFDYEVAVEEGATMVRIGTGLFGARPPASADGR
jgi:pyridoxal phosphate enzyme (YggS family)